jgi:sugar lactone lactonase YvrE
LVIAVLLALTLAVAWYGVNGTPRISSIVLNDDYTVREFVQLPGDEAYPNALALAADGTLYSGSYLTGAVWAISPDADLRELTDTADMFGSVTGLTVLPDNTLVVLDRIDPLQSQGAVLWRIPEAGTPEKFAEIPAKATLIPYDLTSDADGNLYVTIIVNGGADEVLRFAPDGTQSVWWTAPDNATITGLAYDASRASLIVVDTQQSVIYAIPVDTADTGQAAEVLYRHTEARPIPGFDGIAAAPDGTLYIAALGLNRVVRLDVDAAALTELAGAFRGSSRVAYDTERQRLYVNNWDQRSLLPEKLVFIEIDVLPRLPFSIDVVEPTGAQN